eukprot:Sdes_comp20266_c0_seq1m13792
MSEINFIFPNGLPEDVLKISAYAAMLVLAIFPIWVGSHRSAIVKTGADSPAEVVTSKDAAMFPFVASLVLLGLYFVFKYVPQNYISVVVTGYFFFIGTFALTNVLRVVVLPFLPDSFTHEPFHFSLTQEKKKKPDCKKSTSAKPESGSEESGSEVSYDTLADSSSVATTTAASSSEKVYHEDLFSLSLDKVDLVSFGVSLCLGVWYVAQKHWIANNIFGLAFSINGIEMISLGNVKIGCLLLGGLFFYDIFWVFGTDVMVTVAKSFDAPIKLLFPKDFLINGIFATQFTMLGLGDIVIPGIFLALLLRFDRYRCFFAQKGSNRKNSLQNFVEFDKKYFKTGYISYIVGMLATFSVMHIFNHAQPALLYLVPTCISGPLLVAAFSGELKALFAYDDESSNQDKKTSKSCTKSKNSTCLTEESLLEDSSSANVKKSSSEKKKLK